MQELAVCEFLPWDSEFFGRRIARVIGGHLTGEAAKEVLAWCADQKVDCLYFLAEATDMAAVRVVEACDFRLVDIRITLGMKLPPGRCNPSDMNTSGIRPCQSADLPALRALAKTSHRETRFYADNNFPRALCDRLYEIWLEKSCQGYADQVLIAEASGHPIGYISCHSNPPDAARIGLFAVAENEQGQGTGARLLRAAIGWFRNQEIQRVKVVTQGGNVRAQRAYQRAGFRTDLVQLWYHRWFPTQAGLP